MLEDAVYTHEWLLFISLCETGSLKESAELFSLSTSAASRALKRLEDTLEVTLFDRCSKPMIPTPDGKILYSRVKAAMKSTREALENVREKNSLHQELRIGFLESMSLSIVPQFLSSFKTRVGTITCLTGSSDRLIERLKKHDVDIIVSSDPALKNTDWKRILMIREPSVALFPKGIYFGEGLKKLSWNQLSLCNLPFINSYGKSGRGKLVNNFLITYGIQLVGRIKVDNLAIKLSMVANKNGWTITSPLSLLNYPAFTKDIEVIPLPAPGMERRIYLIANELFPQDLFEEIAKEVCKLYSASVLPIVKTLCHQNIGEFHIRQVTF